jgi:hypothetical protein
LFYCDIQGVSACSFRHIAPARVHATRRTSVSASANKQGFLINTRGRGGELP